MYFVLKENFMHYMHHALVLFAFVCICLLKKDWNIIFQLKIYLIKMICLGYMLPNKIFCCLQVWFIALIDLFDYACLNLIYGCCSNYFISGYLIILASHKSFCLKILLLKSYIRVLRKPLCILYFISLKNYFKVAFKISHICFIKTLPYFK